MLFTNLYILLFKAVIYICIETFVHKTSIVIIMDTCIPIIMYCQRLFLLFTGLVNNIVYIFNFFGRPIYLQ